MCLPNTDTLWWNVHGRQDDASAHANMCCYCEVGWRKKRPDLSQEMYIQWCQSEEGQNSNNHWTEIIIDKRRGQGRNFRLSAKQVAAWPSPPPVELRRQTAEESQVIEPDEIFILEADYLRDHKIPPSAGGIQCEWITRKNGVREYGFWKKSLDPVRRRHLKKDTLLLDEVFVCSVTK